METEYLSWNMSMLVAFVFIIAVAVFVRLTMWPDGREKPVKQPVETPPHPPRPKREAARAESIFTRRNNGWVRVSRTIFQLTQEESDNIHRDLGAFLPVIVSNSLYTLPITERGWLAKGWSEWANAHQTAEGLSHTEDRKRGLTIGSAFFGYAIPEHLVLFDRRTRQLCGLFTALQKRKETYEAWQWKEAILVDEHVKRVTDGFEVVNNIQVEKAFEFYIKYESKFQKLLLHTINESSLLPSFQGLMRRMSWEEGLASDPIAEHYYLIALTVVARNLEVVLPIDWFMFSKASEETFIRVQAYIRDVVKDKKPDQRPRLSLAVDNTNT